MVSPKGACFYCDESLKMKFPIRIRQEENELILDAVPAFAIVLNYRVLDTVRGQSVEEVEQKTKKLLSDTLHRFILADEYVGLPRMLSIYQKSELQVAEHNKIWTTVDIEVDDLALPVEQTSVTLPADLVKKLQAMASTIDSSVDMMLTVLLAHTRAEYKKD